MTLQANLDLTARWNDRRALDLSTPVDAGAIALTDELLHGTAIDQADLLWHDRRTLAATSENLDLAGGLTDAFGQTLTFAKIKALLIKNRETIAGRTLKVGGHATAAFLLFDNATDIYTIGPDGILLVWDPALAGKVVTATTGDLLKIDAGANTVAYDILLIGTSA